MASHWNPRLTWDPYAGLLQKHCNLPKKLFRRLSTTGLGGNSISVGLESSVGHRNTLSKARFFLREQQWCAHKLCFFPPKLWRKKHWTDITAVFLLAASFWFPNNTCPTNKCASTNEETKIFLGLIHTKKTSSKQPTLIPGWKVIHCQGQYLFLFLHFITATF